MSSNGNHIIGSQDSIQSTHSSTINYSAGSTREAFGSLTLTFSNSVNIGRRELEIASIIKKLIRPLEQIHERSVPGTFWDVVFLFVEEDA